MDSNTRNILLLVGVVAAVYFFTMHKDRFTPLGSAPFDGPLDDDGTTATVAAAPLATAASPMPAATAAQVADAAWQNGAKSINPYAANFVDSRAMDGINSIGGYTRKNSTWDVRGAVPIQRDPSASFFGISSRMPPPPTGNQVFCANTATS